MTDTKLNENELSIKTFIFRKFVSLKYFRLICLYCPYYVTRTSANDSAVYWSRDIDGDT